MKILIVAGGGGHFAPALALLDDFPKDWEVLIIGRKYTFEGDKTLSFEYQTAQKLGIPFTTITTGRIQRKFTRHSFFSLLKIPYGFFQSVKILKKFKPNLVLSFGGYVSVPVTLAAYLLRIPIVIHEQIMSAGLANKIAGKFADAICISWEQSKKYFPEKKVILTGNPLHHSFLKRANDELKIKKTLPVIFITGGSSGSHAFNELVEGCLENLLEKYIVIHQTGDAKNYNDYDRLLHKKQNLPDEKEKRYVLTKFIDPDKFVDFLKQADLVISRAGINTVSQLLFLGKPAFLIPLPYGQRNEQKENAVYFKETGLGEMADQNLLNSDSFLTNITAIMNKLQSYKAHADSAKKLIRQDASQKILEVINNVTK